MTQPPPPLTYTSPYGYVPPRQPNGWAIVSLVCGIIGCFLVTPLVAIGTGIVGIARSRRLGNGRGMAIAGLLLGLAWVLFWAGIGAFAWYGYGKFTALEKQAVPQTISILNRVQQGQTTPDATTGQLTAAQLQDLADKAKGLGVCQSIKAAGFKWEKNNGQAENTIDGTAEFEHGQRPVHAKMKVQQNGTALVWDFEELELK